MVKRRVKRSAPRRAKTLAPRQAANRLPPQVPPVRRPEIVAPHTVVDVEHGDADSLVRIRMELMHGANFNDPAPYHTWSMGRLRVSGLG